LAPRFFNDKVKWACGKWPKTIELETRQRFYCKITFQELMIEDTFNAVQPEQPAPDSASTQPLNEEIGGVKGLEPTRYGDWEKNGRCVDF
jgi:hypothetical protein